MLNKILKWLSVIAFGGLMGCKDPGINNIHKDGNGQFLTMNCPPYGVLTFRVDDGEQLGEEWDSDKSKCMNWIQDNWNTLWPIVEFKLKEMASKYSDSNPELGPYLSNTANSLHIGPADKEHWTLSLTIIKEHPGMKWRGSNSFCIDMEKNKVLEYQIVY